MLAGVATLLPAFATVASVIYVERAIAQSGLAAHPLYFPGCGLLLVVVGLYVVGVIATTLLGRWFVVVVDGVLNRIPALNSLYRTAKGVLGVGEGKDAFFRCVVLIENPERGVAELGFLTNEIAPAGLGRRQVVFLPSSPNPLVGRLVLAPADRVRRLDIPVQQALQLLLTAGGSHTLSTTSNAASPTVRG
jgi:uncharacterized membrane protein